MRNSITYVKKELDGLYPPSEIQNFVYLIFEHLLNFSKIDVHTKQDTKVSNSIFLQIKDYTKQLKQYKPIQYILRRSEFYSLPFYVAPGVLIPRPETEELVHLIITENKKSKPAILDIGTGSGCIAVSLACNMPQASMSALDISNDALKIAHKNAITNKAQIEFIKSNILEWEQDRTLNKKRFDIIVSNPPYVCEKEKALMEKNVLDFEPGLAIFVPDTHPLKFYKAIVSFAETCLKPGGLLYFEINENYGKDVLALHSSKLWDNSIIIQDIHGKDRMVRAKKISAAV